MSKKPIASCPICGGTSLKKRMTCKDYFVSHETFDLYKCTSCGFIRTADVPDEQHIGKYYESESYVSHSDTNKGFMNKAYHLVREYMVRRKVRLSQRATQLKKGSFLDVGAGTGFFAHKMQEAGWDTFAIEPSAQARDRANQTFNLDLKGNELWEELPDNSLDLITLWHVLEHIPDLDQTWSRFSRVLKPSGALIIALPNANSYDARVYQASWAAYDVPRHLWHFKPSTFKQNAHNHGFKIVKTLTMPFDGFYISIMTEKNLGHKFPLLRGAWIGLKGYLKSLINKENSSSLIYVLKKIES